MVKLWSHFDVHLFIVVIIFLNIDSVSTIKLCCYWLLTNLARFIRIRKRRAHILERCGPVDKLVILLLGSVIHCLRVHDLSFIVLKFVLLPIIILVLHHAILLLFWIFNIWLAITKYICLFWGSWFLAHLGAFILFIINNFSFLEFSIVFILLIVLLLIEILTLAVTDALLLLIVAEVLVIETFFRLTTITHLFFKIFYNFFFL